MISARKEEKNLKHKQALMQEETSYRWKLSVVKHRR